MLVIGGKYLFTIIPSTVCESLIFQVLGEFILLVT